MILFVVTVFSCVGLVNAVPPWRDAVNENDNPKGLEDNTVMDDIEKANEVGQVEKSKENVFEGDIELTKSDEDVVDMNNTSSGDTADVDVDSIVTKRKAIFSKHHLWLTKEVPLELETTATEAWANIIAAVDEIQKKSCVRFRMKEDGDDNWIYIAKRIGCYSKVGRQYTKKGPQVLSIGDGCNKKGIILHELLHALGFWHEQSRSDRDKYIEVLWNNIQEGQEHNFNRYRKKYVDYAGSVYDLGSIMHYGNLAFSKNSRPTMLSVKNPFSQFGQIKAMSDNDVIQLNALYDCKSEKSAGWSKWGSWSPCDMQCSKKRERFCSAKDIKKCAGADNDRVQVQETKCPNDECYVPVNGNWGRWGPWTACTVSCGQGYQTRSRKCDEPKPLYGGKYCNGMLVAARNCMLKKSCGWRKRNKLAIMTDKHKKMRTL